MTQRTSRGGALAAVTLLAVGLQACGGSEHEPPEAVERAAVAVTVTDAWAASADRTYAARVEAGRQVEVATRASGRLQSVPVDVGDRVGTGQVVARLDGGDVEARIQSAEAHFALAERTHGRVSRLAAEGAASAQELDQAVAALESARAALAEARAQADYIEVTAPFAGTVIARMADPGDLAVPGRPVLRIQGDGERLVVADLPVEAQSEIVVGQALVARYDGASASVTVSRVVPALDPASRRFRVEARLDAGSSWPPGAVVRLDVAGAGGGSLWVPEDAVVRRGQLTGVFAVEADTVRLRWLRLGRESDGAVEVLAGPVGTLTVGRRPTPEVVDGAPVSGVTREAGR
ncbi:MAG: efflux RND transporter periplasmic adaptor subunit [Gemmatimonadetes bacterium]|nr:efflux RND transporter periplasmic adaptor subunit [Gemmatimonadota bacterium]